MDDDFRAYSHARVELLDLVIVDRDTTSRPIDELVRQKAPGVWLAMDANAAADPRVFRNFSFGFERSVPSLVVCIWIRQRDESMEALAHVSSRHSIFALWSSSVAFELLGSGAAATDRHGVGLEQAIAGEHVHSMVGLVDDDSIDLSFLEPSGMPRARTNSQARERQPHRQVAETARFDRHPSNLGPERPTRVVLCSLFGHSDRISPELSQNFQ